MKKNNLLESIKSPNDIKKIPIKELYNLSNEVSSMIKETIEENGGHYSSPLGVVDLTVALHYVFTFITVKLFKSTNSRFHFQTYRKYDFNKSIHNISYHINLNGIKIIYII